MLQIVKAFQFQFESLQASSLCARRELSWAALFCWGCLFLCLEHSGSAAQAQDFLQNFDGQEVSCKVSFDPKNIKLTTHERNQSLAFSGQAAERFQFQARKDDVFVVIESDIEPTRIFEDLSISIVVFANRPGTQLVARVVFPGQTDPETRKPLTKLLHGDILEKATTWQKLICDTSDKNLTKHLVLWRASLIPQVLDPRGMYIDKIYLKQTIGRGLTEILVDDLHVFPVVSPAQVEQFAT
ncbi:MAG: hypothetical protein JKY95_00365, partial [Planctomycetaceae bacterium]|nr:hypothetical protein [Planctomycetaceae bacterium]